MSKVGTKILNQYSHMCKHLNIQISFFYKKKYVNYSKRVKRKI